jgi:GAF domain-containing protein
MMYVSDRKLYNLIPERLRKSHGQAVKGEIEGLLWRMCTVLAYRVGGHAKKGATFLVLESDAPDAPFTVFAQVHHDQAGVSQEIRKHLNRDRGLAAKALSENKCVVIHDCLNPSRDSGWVETHAPPRFRGRAAAPVEDPISGKKIGALCFDVKTPYTLKQDEQDLMVLIADKIAGLWSLYQ